VWFRGIGRLPVGASAPLVLLSPLVATVVGAGLLGESLGAVQGVGFVVALAAMAAAQVNAPDWRGRGKVGRGMRIAVLGATGMVGRRVVAEAGRRGHRVIALSRKPEGGEGDVTPRTGAEVTPVAVDASDGRAVREALVASAPDAVVLTVRTEPVDQDFLVATTRTVLDTAAELGVRALVIGGAGALRSPGDPARRAADDPAYVPASYREVALAGVAQLHACEAHSAADWAYLSPPALLEPGERTGRYRRGTDTLLTTSAGTSWISAEDLAVAVVDELEVPYGTRHFTVVHRD
jgi:putative NADH-flavin reductase